MTRREAIIAHLAERPGLTAWELGRVVGDSGSLRPLLAEMRRAGQLTAAAEWQVQRGRSVTRWYLATPGTRPRPMSAEDIRLRDRKRRRDRDYKRRIRAIAKGENPPTAESIAARRLALPEAIPDRGRWRSRAACRDADPELFFSPDSADIARAQQICAGCPVRAECGRAAEANHEQFGVWAGIDRAALARGRAAS